MTISSTLARNDYSGTTSVGPYVYGFKITAATDLQVIKRSLAGTETTLTYLTDYTVAGAGNDAGGSITLISAPLSTDVLAIRRKLPITQPASIRNQGAYLPETIEDQLDRAVLIEQQQEDAIERSLKLPPSYNPSGRARHLVPTAGYAVVGDGTGFTTAAISSSSAVSLPGNGRTVSTLSAYLADNAVFNVLDYGAVGDGVTNDATKLQAAHDAALAAGGLLLLPAGRTFYLGSTTLQIRCNCEGTGAQVNYDGTGIAVQCGDGTNLFADVCIKLPKVVNTAKNTLGWGVQTGGKDITNTIGVKLVGMYQGELHVPYVKDFAVGLLEYGIPAGGAYTTIYLGALNNNKINMLFDTQDANSWVNENLHIGGRLSHVGGVGGELQGPNTYLTGQPGVRHVKMKTSALVHNNHRWIGTSMEGDVPEYMVDIDGAMANLFLHCRWESQNPKIRINGGANAIRNVFRGGYDLQNAVWTFSGGSKAGDTLIEHGGGLRYAPGDAAAVGVMVLGNGFTSANPILSLLDSGVDTTNFGTAWSVQIGSRTLAGKATGDAAGSPRITIDFTTGALMTKGQAALVGGLYSGKSTQSTTTGTFTTLFSATPAGRYSIAWSLIGSGSGYVGIAEVVSDGAVATIITNTVGANTSATMSGNNFQIKQISGSTQVMNYTYKYMPF